MKLAKKNVGGRDYHSVNGKPIRPDTLEAIGKEIFVSEYWKAIQEKLHTVGYADVVLHPEHFDTEDDYLSVNKKIAALEKRVSELTIQNIYLAAR